MKETIYLVVTRNKVERMTKNLPVVSRDELPIRIEVTVNPKAFGAPTLIREVVVNDWREGIDITDIEFRGQFITPDEAEVIRKRRLAKMAEILTSQGFVVTDPEAGDDA